MPVMGENNPIDRVAIWLSTGLGVGLVSPAPGTVGGLWGLPLAWAMGGLATGVQVLLLIGLLLVSVAICTMAAQAMGGEKDPPSIVLDEIAALPIVYLGVADKNLAIWIAGFLLFRVFDIFKPFPVRQAEQLPSGWGIMLDDYVAAIYALISLNCLMWFDRVFQWGLLLPTA